MSALLQAPSSSDLEPDGAASDRVLVAQVRRSDDRAFEALYARYHRRIHAYVLGMVKDHQRAEDVTQEVFVSALRRMRATERPIAFKPWVYEIAKNACIDQFRRSKRTEEVSIDADEGLAPSDYGRLVSPEPVPDAALAAKQELDDLCGAFGGLSDAHHEILVLRELEGLSYQQIGERMGMSRPAVESTLFRARRRLSEEYDELASGQRCQRIQSIIVNASSSRLGARDTRRLARHVAHCQPCRREAVAAGVDSAILARRPLRRRAIDKVAGLLPFPLLPRGRRGGSAASEGWANQLPAISDHAAAGGAKLAAVAAVVVAGLGAGVGTQVVPGGDDRPAGRSTTADERQAPERVSAAASSFTAPAAAGTDSSTAGDRSPRGERTVREERGGRGAGADGAPRSPAGSERRPGESQAPSGAGDRARSGAGGQAPSGGGGASPTDTVRERSDPLQETVRDRAPAAPQTPSAGDRAGGIDLPLPSLPGKQGSGGPVEAVGESIDAVTPPPVRDVVEDVDDATSGVTDPVTDVVEDVDDAASGVTDPVTDPVTDAVDDVTGDLPGVGGLTGPG